MRSRVYLGHIDHARIEPVGHSFRYPAFVFALDVDELPELDRRLRLFSHNRRALFSLHDGDYLGTHDADLRIKLRERIGAAGSDIALDRIELVTTPRVAGHTFNPVSFYYCYGEDTRIAGIVAEVNNTFGEAHVYVLPEREAVLSSDDRLLFSAPKSFHVSPFNDMQGTYEFDFAALTERLEVRIDIRREQGKAFATRLTGKARALDDRALCRLALAYPFTAALTLPRIMFQAYRLHYRQRLPVFAKPDPTDRNTFHATRPAYISEFSAPSWLQRRSARTETSEDRGSH